MTFTIKTEYNMDVGYAEDGTNMPLSIKADNLVNKWAEENGWHPWAGGSGWGIRDLQLTHPNPEDQIDKIKDLIKQLRSIVTLNHLSVWSQIIPPSEGYSEEEYNSYESANDMYEAHKLFEWFKGGDSS